MLNTFGGLSFQFLGLCIKSLFHQFGHIAKFSIHLSLIRFSERVVKFLCQQRFGCFCLFHGLPHLIEQIIESFSLLTDLLLNLLAIVFTSETGSSRLVLQIFQLSGKLFLFLLQVLCIISHLPDSLIELARCALPEFVSQFLKLTFSSSPRSECLSGVLLLQRLRCLSHIFPGLLDLL